MAKPRAHKTARRRRSGIKFPPAKATKLPKGALTLVVMMRSKEGQRLLLEAELRALIGPSRKEEGCLQYDLHRGADHPDTFLFHEVWASRTHHDAHTRTPHFLRWNARKDALLASNDSVFYELIA